MAEVSSSKVALVGMLLANTPQSRLSLQKRRIAFHITPLHMKIGYKEYIPILIVSTTLRLTGTLSRLLGRTLGSLGHFDHFIGPEDIC